MKNQTINPATEVIKLSNTKNNSVSFVVTPDTGNSEHGPDCSDLQDYLTTLDEYKLKNSLTDTELIITPATHSELIECGYLDPEPETKSVTQKISPEQNLFDKVQTLDARLCTITVDISRHIELLRETNNAIDALYFVSLKTHTNTIFALLTEIRNLIRYKTENRKSKNKTVPLKIRTSEITPLIKTAEKLIVKLSFNFNHVNNN